MANTNSILINIGAKTAQAVKEINNVNRALGEQMTATQKTGAAFKRMNAPAIAALGAIAAGSGLAIKAASDLGETMNAVDKVFGDSAKTITDFGEGAAKSVGLSQRAFQELATSTGSLLTNMGQNTQLAADNTLILSQRAADMASVFNTDVSTALDAINSGLRGESEPLRQFGVSLSDNAIKSQAMAMGLYDGKGALDSSARAAAIQALILEQTSKVAGDFADTSDGAANAQRILAAETENTSASLGDVLLPVYERLVAVLQTVVTWIKNNQTTTQVLVGIVAALAATVVTVNAAMSVHAAVMTIVRSRTIATTVSTVAYHVITKTIRLAILAWTAAQWLLNIALSANPIGLVIAAIALLIGGIILAYNKSETFRNIIQKLWGALKTFMNVALIPLKIQFQLWAGILSTVFGWLERIWQKIKDNPVLGKIVGGGSVSLYGSSGPSLFSGGGVPSRRAGGTVVININGAIDPATTARQVKRLLENYDVSQGRDRGAPLAVAW